MTEPPHDPPNAPANDASAAKPVRPATVLSGIQPSGILHLGNYFGADTVSGKSRATSVAVDTRGNVVVAGQYYGYADFENAPERTVGLATTNPLGASFFWKVDRGGRTVWANELEATGKIETNAVAVDGAGNIYAGGAATGVVDFDTRPANSYFVNFGATRSAFAVKLSTTGETSWAQNVSGTSEVTGLGIDGQGNVTLGGNFSGRANFSTTPLNGILDSAGGQDGFAWRLSAAGNFLWARGFGGASEDSVTDVNVNRTGQALFVGTFKGTADFDPSAARLTLASTQTNGYLLKLSSLGFLSYAARLGRPSSPTLPTGVWGDTAGNAHVVGTFEGTNDFDPTEAVNELKASNGSTFLAKYYLTFLTPPRGNDPLETPNNNGVSAGSGYTISEGQGLTLQATANGLESAVFSWDINGDGQFDDARGMYVVLNPQQMIALGLGDSKATPINVRVRVSDGINPFIEAKTTLTINNIAPVAHFLSPPRIRVGIGPALTLQSVSDPSRTDGQAGFRYSFDFDNDGKFDLGNGQTYSGSSVLSNIQAPRGLFRQLGPRTIRIRVFDKDNGYSDSLVNITVFDGPIQLRFR